MRRISVSRLLSTVGMLATSLFASIAFAAPQYAAPYGNDPGYRDGQVVRCESNDGRSHECSIDSDGRVQLVRQLSGAPCIEGRTWGAGHGRIWVTEGCRGEFAATGGYGNDYGDTGQVVRCESNDGRWHLCAMDTRGDIQLVRRLSDSACVEGRGWGRDPAGVWVNQGCRAEFRSIAYSAGAGAGGGQSIRCESSDGRYRQCSGDVRGSVRLVRQLSDARCIEGRTWGANRAGVWVDEGCRAEFETGYRGNNGWGLGQYRGKDRYGQGYGYTGRTLRCESSDGRTNRCNVAIQGGARLQRQLSDARCVQGSNWGWDRSGIWVSGGCRAEFAIW
jgi:hypothetical protein